MANEKIHEYVQDADGQMLASGKNFFDADLQINSLWTSVKVSVHAIREVIILGVDSNGVQNGMLLANLSTNEILAIPNPQIGNVVFNTTHDTICFYASNGWQRLNHQPM